MPRDQRLWAKCNQRMFFNASILSVRLTDIGKPFDGCTEISEDKVNPIVDSLEMLEKFLATDRILLSTPSKESVFLCILQSFLNGSFKHKQLEDKAKKL